MEIFKYIIPAFIVMMTAYLLLDRMFSNEEKKRRYELAKKNQVTVTPIRLRAYERLMLLLERTNPSAMILNIIKPGMTCIEFQTGLLKYIRQEFEHNYSQQVYVSDELWDAINSTRENLFKLVNTTSSLFKPEDSASKMAEVIIRMYSEPEQNPTEKATDLLKEEIRSQFFTTNS